MNYSIKLNSEERIARTKLSGSVSGNIQFAITTLEHSQPSIAITVALDGLRKALKSNDAMFKQELSKTDFNYK